MVRHQIKSASTEKCPGCGEPVVLKAGDGLAQPSLMNPNGTEHICVASTEEYYKPKPVGQAAIGETVLGFEVRNKQMTIKLSHSKELHVYAGGRPLRIWMITPKGVMEDIHDVER